MVRMPETRPSTGLRLMHVHAHPDDESSKGAASTAMYVAQGVDVHVVTCTGGERGSILNPKMERPDVLENMTEIRRREMEAARDILGVRQDWLGFVDSGWPEGDPKPPLPEGCFGLVPVEDGAAPLVRLIRSFRPHVLTTYDENGGYPHPDHIMCHNVSMAAWAAANDPEQYPDAGEPWQPLKLYYQHGFNRPRTQALHDAMVEHGLESPWGERLKEWKPDPKHDARITTRVPCARLLRGARPGADGARHADRPRRAVLPYPARHPARGLADGGLRAGREPRRDPAPGGRPVRRDPGHTGRGVLSGTCDNGVMNPHVVLTFVLPLVDRVPKDDDVKAGWTAFAIFVALAVAVALLGVSLVRHLRKAQANKDAGMFGDEPDAESEHRT